MAITHPARIATNGTKRKRPQEIKLNLGSGRFLLDGFINVDNFADPDPDSKAEFRKGDIRNLPFDSESADYILADNVLEHLPMRDQPRAMHEIRRVLKTGGRCVIVVPDFADVCKQWLQFDAGMFNPILYTWFAEIIYGNQYHEGEYHRTPMSKGFLNYIIQTTGFLNYQMIIYPQGAPLESDRFPGVPGTLPGHSLRNQMIIVDITESENRCA